MLFAAVALVAVAVGPDVYSGVDGKFNQDLITTYLSFGRPFVVNVLNPLEGAFSQLFPLNIWLNPGFAQFLIFDHDTALIISTAIFLLIYCVAIYCLARTVGLGPGVAVVGAQLGAFAFPPLYHAAGLFSNFDLMPGAALTVALFTLLLCVLLRIREVSWRNLAVGSGLATALIGYIVFNDPLTMGVIGFSFLIPFAVAILEGRLLPVIAIRTAVLAVAAAILYALGLVHYVLAMDHYTARFYLRDEFFRPQTTDFVSVMFDYPESARTYGFFIIGWMLGLFLCRGRQRLAVLMAVANFLCLVAYGAIYLFATFHWFAPLPIYIEEYTIHIAALGALAGWAALVRRFVPAPDSRLAAMIAALLLPGLIAIYGASIPAWMRGHYHEPWADEPELVAYLNNEIGLHDGADYKGTAYVFMLGYRDELTYVNLWRNSIPTVNEYSQTLSPNYEYFLTHLVMKTAADSEHSTGLFSSEHQSTISALNASALQAIGGRFVLSTYDPEDLVRHYGEFQADLRGILAGKVSEAPTLDRTWYLYELPHPNCGQYTPTAVRVANSAPESLEIFQESGFDWQKEAVLNSSLSQPLVKAHSSHMLVERGRVRIQAESDGTSLLVLPIQYSHCLSLESASNARLIRADFLMTGLIFKDKVDTAINFDLGFFNAACREEDYRDLARLRVKSSKSMQPDSNAQNPYAVRSLRMLPEQIREVMRHMKFQ